MTIQSSPEFIDVSVNEVPVRGYLHRSADPRANGLILTHGAGANCQSLLLTTLASAFCVSGMTVLRCDLPFRQSRPKGPPSPGSADRDQKGLRAAVEFMRSCTAGQVFLGGHSYGGRQASMLAANQPGLVEMLLLLSYPLHPPQRPGELRTKHFPQLQTPALFIHGTSDGFGSIAEMEEALKLIPARTELSAIAGAGHELMTTRNCTAVSEQVIQSFISFARAH
jgi:uncharacterized protein